MLFFFKQKTAYEMRISDWSSDVCSSDLRGLGEEAAALGRGTPRVGTARTIWAGIADRPSGLCARPGGSRRPARARGDLSAVRRIDRETDGAASPCRDRARARASRMDRTGAEKPP